MAAIGRVAAVFSASTKDLEDGVDRAANAMRGLGSSAQSLSSSLASIAANAATSALHSITGAAERAGHAFYELAKEQAETIDVNSKLAQRLGVTYEELSGIKLAGDLADVSMDSLAKAMTKADVAFVRASKGSKMAQGAIEGVGLSVEELNGMTPAERFSAIADAIAKLPTPAHQAEAAVRLFGKAGAGLLPLFQKGAGEIEHATNQAKAFGLALTDKQGKNVEAMNDAFKLVSESIKGIVGQVVSNLAPAITKMTEQFVEFVGTIGGKNIGTAIADAIIAGARVLAQVGDYFVTKLPPLWEHLQSVASVWNNVWEFGSRVADLFFGCWKAFEAVGNAIGAAISFITDKLLRAIAWIADWIPGFDGVADHLGLAADHFGQATSAYGDAFFENVTSAGNSFSHAAFGSASQAGTSMAGPLTTALDDVIARMEEARKQAEKVAQTPIDVKETVALMEGAKVTVEGLDGTAIDGVRQAILDGETVQEQQLSRLEDIRAAMEEWGEDTGGDNVELIEADFAY